VPLALRRTLLLQPEPRQSSKSRRRLPSAHASWPTPAQYRMAISSRMQRIY
jgi:hypothetical protein